MDDFTITLGSGDVIQLAILVGGFLWGYANLNARVKALESHGPKIDEIQPLKAAFDGFKNSVNHEFKNLRDDFRDLAQTVREVLSRA